MPASKFADSSLCDSTVQMMIRIMELSNNFGKIWHSLVANPLREAGPPVSQCASEAGELMNSFEMEEESAEVICRFPFSKPHVFMVLRVSHFKHIWDSWKKKTNRDPMTHTHVSPKEKKTKQR